jgi:hypothetical protein
MDKTNLDPNHGRLGMGPLELAGAIAALDQREMDDPMKGAAQAKDPNPLHLPHALGDWLTPEPTEGEFCTVKEPNDIEQDLKFVQGRAAYPDGGGALDPIPALNIKYHWTDVRFYNTPASPGTQLVANLSLTRTDGLPDGGAGTPCTSQYHVVGLWPAIDCTADPPPGGGMPPSPIDETKCSPEPDNTKNRPTGSGISPDLLTRCHPDLHLCVLVKEPPSFK